MKKEWLSWMLVPMLGLSCVSSSYSSDDVDPNDGETLDVIAVPPAVLPEEQSAGQAGDAEWSSTGDSASAEGEASVGVGMAEGKQPPSDVRDEPQPSAGEGLTDDTNVNDGPGQLNDMVPIGGGPVFSKDNATDDVVNDAQGRSAATQPQTGDLIEKEADDPAAMIATDSAKVPASDHASAESSAQPLKLLNSEVAPGTSANLAWRPSSSFNSITAPTTVLTVNGVRPGPTLCLTAAIHGDELNGIEIVRKVLFDIDPMELTGAVIGVPIVNLDGFRRASRYLTDRRDLNRFFPGNPQGSSAARLAHSFFTQVISHCDLLIDLHTGSFRRTNLPQLRADLTYTQVTDLADKMGSILVVQSKGATGSLRRAAVEAGIPAVTLEAGAAHEFSRVAVNAGVKSVESALDGLKMLKLRRFWEAKPQPIYYDSTWVRAANSGILFSNVVLGQNVKKGEVLGTITDPITNAQAVVVAPIDGHIIGKALNQIMFPGFAAYHLGYAAQPHPELDLTPSKEEGGDRGAQTPSGVTQPAEQAPAN
jgi:predicted deacylase